ncbi:MAG: alpha-L-fucosidase [Sphaerochaetaceae bacterium]
MKQTSAIAFACLSGIFWLSPFAAEKASAADTYQETWTSVGKHTAAPEWFQDAKFGIYFHWGAYTVPAYGSEWYPRNMYNKDGWEYKHHTATYGDPYGDWQYHNFILGKNDKSGKFCQFAPKLKSAGGNFDPEEWAALFDSAGAKFAGLVAEHHDGFSLWKSKVNEWNSVDKGPKLDLSDLLAKAIRAKNMKFIMTMHHAWNYSGYWYYGNVTQTDTSLKKLYGQLDKNTENQLWFDKLKEIIDQYQPDLIWHDLYLSVVPEAIRLKFLAYYYNKSVDWNKDVVVTSKDGFKDGEVSDFERGGPADIQAKYWLTDDAISQSSWSYTDGMKYYSSKQILHALIDRVSKNGNMLLDISPMADGTIPDGQRSVLYDIGDWLRKFGTSIYKTRAWSIYGEGPTTMGGGSFTGPKEGTGSDVRYTKAKDNSAVYAIFLGWPGKTFTLTGFKKSSLTLPSDAKVELMGMTPGTDLALQYTQNDNGLVITLPESAPYSAMAYPVRVTLKTVVVEDPGPYDGIISLPGKIEAENYDKGGEGIAYHDNDYGNNGKAYRDNDVDIVPIDSTDNSQGYAVGYTVAGEWLNYSIELNDVSNVEITGNLSSGSDDSRLRLLIDDKPVIDTFKVENTGNWDTYKEVSLGSADLAAKGITKGEHTLKLMIAGSYVNVDWLKFSEKTTSVKSLKLVTDSQVKYKVFDLQGNLLMVLSAKPSEITDKFKAQSAMFPHGSYLLKSSGSPEKTMLIKK